MKEDRAVKRLFEVAPQDAMLTALLERQAAERPDETFFTWTDATYSLGFFNASVNRMARNLQDHGVVKGTHVAVFMDTSPDYLTLWFALAKIGAVEVPINTAYRGDLLRHAFDTSQAELCVLDAHYCEQVLSVAPGLRTLRRLIVRGAPAAANDPIFRIEPFGALLAANHSHNLQADIHFSETCGIIFTSGTTGPSKGVMLSHHYLAAYGFMYAEINELGSDDVILNYLPFFHIGAKFLTIATLVSGGRMRLVPRLSITGFWDEVRAHGVTNFVAVGGVCNMLLARPRRADDIDTTIRTIYAVPDAASIHDELEQRFGCKLTTVFGSTEAGLPMFRPASGPYRAGTCGRVSPYYDVALVDENDVPVPTGSVGEIVVRPKRSWLTGSGYIGMPDRTVASWRNQWLHSGDRARMDSDGWFYFEDRVSDSIRRRGENISSYEVEQIVGKHPSIAEVAAIPAASELGEDEVWLQVILRADHALTPEEILLYCEQVMPYFMIPRFIDIVLDLPRTPTAKVEKYKLRQVGPSKQTWDRDKEGWILSRTGLRRAQ